MCFVSLVCQLKDRIAHLSFWVAMLRFKSVDFKQSLFGFKWFIDEILYQHVWIQNKVDCSIARIFEMCEANVENKTKFYIE